MTAERTPETSYDHLSAAQDMTEWFSDYVFGFSDEVGVLPEITRERMDRQFGEQFVNARFVELRDVILRADEDHQSSLALYICGYPDDAMDALTEEGSAGAVVIIDKYLPPFVDTGESSGMIERQPAARPTKESITPSQKMPRRVGAQAVRSVSRDIEGRDLVGLYLEEIGKEPLLDAEQEVELSKTIEAGLFAKSLLEQQRSGRKNGGAPSSATLEELEWIVEEGDRATQQFIQANLRLVVSIARKYGRAQMPMLDLIQEGNTGLIRAVEKFDYTKGFKFSTYATWWVRQAITRGIAQQSRIVRLPVHVVEEVNQIGSARRSLEKTLGREVEPEDIAAELSMDVSRVMDLLTWSKDHVSLDAPVGEDGETSLGDLIARDTAPGPDAEIFNAEANEALNQLVGILDDRSADIIRRRYGLSDGRIHKLADIGVRHGISAERVRQLEREALQKLRHVANPNLAQ